MKTEVVRFRITPELKAKLQAAAAAENRTMSNFLENLIQSNFAKDQQKMKIFTADRQTGTFIDSFDALVEAKAAIEGYLIADYEDDPDSYDPNFYDIVDEDHMSIDCE